MATITSEDPKYQRLASLLRERIKSGHLRPGDRLPSFFEMRTQYGATQRTTEMVHQLLEGDGLIVRQNGRGVFVAQPAARLRTGIIGCVGSGFSQQADFYWMRLMRGMQTGAHSSGRQLMLVDHPEQWSSYETVDGIVINGSLDSILPHLPPGLPCVSLLHQHPEVPCVTMNEEMGGYLAARHLLDLGHHRIAMLSIEDDALAEQRENGYLRALAEAGVPFKTPWLRRLHIEPSPSFEEQSAAFMSEWIADGWAHLACTALVVFNDHLAIGVIRELRKNGFHVPEQVSVVGFDSTELCDYFTPALTSVEVPLRDIGIRGVQLLLAHIEEQAEAPHQVVLEPRLQVRASTSRSS